MTDNPKFQLQFHAEAGVRKPEPFHTVTDCPACKNVAVHAVINDGHETMIWRQCNECGFEWRELK